MNKLTERFLLGPECTMLVRLDAHFHVCAVDNDAFSSRSLTTDPSDDDFVPAQIIAEFIHKHSYPSPERGAILNILTSL